jgi:hypothetical protein
MLPPSPPQGLKPDFSAENTLAFRDGNFTHGCGYLTRWVRARVPFFTRGLDPHPPRESVGAGAGFIFHPWVTRGYLKFQILMVSTQSDA